MCSKRYLGRLLQCAAHEDDSTPNRCGSSGGTDIGESLHILVRCGAVPVHAFRSSLRLERAFIYSSMVGRWHCPRRAGGRQLSAAARPRCPAREAAQPRLPRELCGIRPLARVANLSTRGPRRLKMQKVCVCVCLDMACQRI